MAGKNKLENKVSVEQKSDAVVSHGEVPTQGIVVSGGQKRIPKKLLVVAGVLLLIVVAISCVTVVPHAVHQHTSSNHRSALVAQAAPLLVNGDATKLAPIVAKIKQEPGYAQDPNCLYVITMYYVNITDSTNAPKYYAQLMKVYDPSKGYTDASLKGISQTPSQLKIGMDALKQQNSEAQKNFFGAPGEGPNGP